MSGKNKVSLIIPVYNNEKGIAECLDSVFRQHYKDFEVIVVDDGSSDGTSIVAKKFPCTIIRLDKNHGAAFARNKGAEEARGSIIVFLDSDCVARKGWLDVIMRDFRKKGIDAVASQYCGNLEKSFISEFAFMELFYREKNFPKYLKTAPSACFTCRKKAFESVGGFPKGFPRSFTAEDILFSYEFGKKHRTLWEPRAAVFHRFRKNVFSYLKQQFSSSMSDALLFIRKPRILLADTFEDKGNYIEVISAALLVLSLILGIFIRQFFIALLLPIAAIFLLNTGFFRFLYRKKGLGFALKSHAIVLIRDLAWLAGAITGAVRGMISR